MRSALVSLAALLLVMVAATGCMEEKVVDVVVKGETSVDFQHGPSAEESFTDEYSVNLAAALDNSLADAGYSRSDIKSALLNGGAYGVIAFSPHDWTVEGKVSVQRIDGTPGPLVVAIDYSVQSLEKALGRKIPIPLAEPGATVIDQALGDYISGGDPILRFEVNNEDVAPDPTTSDRIQFEWKIWVEVQVIVEEETEVLDPY